MIYQYPFDDFVSDFETLRPSIDFEDYDFAEEAMITSQYIRATYSDQTDRVERGCALGMVVSFVGIRSIRWLPWLNPFFWRRNIRRVRAIRFRF